MSDELADDLAFLDAAALAVLQSAALAWHRNGKPAHEMAYHAFEVANAMRIERAMRHQAIDASATPSEK